MKPVDQIILKKEKDDCLRACIASILEVERDYVPNFWEQTQDNRIFLTLLNDWLRKTTGMYLIDVPITEEDRPIFLSDDTFCIVCGKPKGRESSEYDHYVVWRNGVVHDPHPSRSGISTSGEVTFWLFCVKNPKIL